MLLAFQALIQMQAVQKLLESEQPDDDEISNNPEVGFFFQYALIIILVIILRALLHVYIVHTIAVLSPWIQSDVLTTRIEWLS